jgi:hypothetical protein
MHDFRLLIFSLAPTARHRSGERRGRAFSAEEKKRRLMVVPSFPGRCPGLYYFAPLALKIGRRLGDDRIRGALRQADLCHAFGAEDGVGAEDERMKGA